MLLLVVVTLASTTSGCIANMGEFKEALGVVKPASLPPEPTYLPPLARAQANLTSVLAGVPVRFTSEGTRDPDGLALDHAWSFGDGATATGPTVTHAFARPGEYAVRLTVTNAAGLTDVAPLAIQVLPQGRAPAACFEVVDERGQPPAVRDAGTRLVFDASCTRDPDGDALSFEWDFGAGATSHDAKATHAFSKPGLHAVRLKATDATGRAAEVTKTVAVDYRAEQKGAFDLTGPTSNAHAFPLAEGARKLEVTLTFPGGLGGNDLLLVLKDAKGQEVKRAESATPPGAQDDQVRTLALAQEDLARAAPGEWTVEVVKARGLSVEYGLALVEAY